MATPCDTVLAWIDELAHLDPERRAAIEAHAASCAACRRAYEAEQALQQAWSAIPTRQPSRELAAALSRVPAASSPSPLLWPLALPAAAIVCLVATLTLWQFAPWLTGLGGPRQQLRPEARPRGATGTFGGAASGGEKGRPSAAVDRTEGTAAVVAAGTAAATRLAFAPSPAYPAARAVPTSPAVVRSGEPGVGDARAAEAAPGAAAAPPSLRPPEAAAPQPTEVGPLPVRPPEFVVPPTLPPSREPDLGAPATATPGRAGEAPAPLPTATSERPPPAVPSPQPLPTGTATPGEPGRGLGTSTPPAPSPTATSGVRGMTPTAVWNTPIPTASATAPPPSATVTPSPTNRGPGPSPTLPNVTITPTPTAPAASWPTNLPGAQRRRARIGR